jgi:hypothetical protein
MELIEADLVEISIYGYPKAYLRLVVHWGNDYGIAISGAEVVEDLDELKDLHSLWTQYRYAGRSAWLAKKMGVLPIYTFVNRMREAGIDVESLGAKENQNDEYMRALAAGASREELDAIGKRKLKEVFSTQKKDDE